MFLPATVKTCTLQTPAWAELKRVAVDANPRSEALGEPEQILVVAAPIQLTAVAWNSGSWLSSIWSPARGANDANVAQIWREINMMRFPFVSLSIRVLI